MKKRILCYGDSNTWGAIPQEEGRYPKHVRWTGILQEELAPAYKDFAQKSNIFFMDAALYAQASKKDGVHMDPDSHQALGKAIAEKIVKEIF